MLTESSRIKRNAGTSPLLKLPLEVQQNIFAHLLGDRDIHVKLKYIEGGQFIAHGDLPPDSMNALGTCRQLYTIANPVFWSTNTFCFDEPGTFTKWLKRRTAHEKRSLRSIHLTQDLDAFQWLFLSPLDIKYLTGLRDLRLTLHQRFLGFSFEDCKETFGSIDQMFTYMIRGLDKLAMLPLKRVEISMKARTQDEVDARRPPTYRPWSQDEVNEFVDMVKRMLLDTDPVGTKARLEAEHKDRQKRLIGSDNTK